jgi:uncharacterized membrane protein
MNKIKFILVIVLALPLVVACTSSPEPEKKVFQPKVYEAPEQPYTGLRGQALVFTDGQAMIDTKVFDDGKAHYYNTEISNKTVYFFVVKDKNGVYRAAGNACQVCSDARQGFVQVGDFMQCNTCGNKYPLDKIATEKGGCNPVPVNPNLQEQNGKLIINQSELKVLNSFF